MPFVELLIPLVGKIFDGIFTSKQEADTAKAKLAEELASQQFQVALAEIMLAQKQIDTNIEEAKVGQNLKTDWMEFFIAAWRPAIGWIGGAALAYNAILLPASEFVAKVGFHYTGAFPEVNLTLLGEVLLGLLGMGALRSMDKKTGAANGA